MPGGIGRVRELDGVRKKTDTFGVRSVVLSKNTSVAQRIGNSAA